MNIFVTSGAGYIGWELQHPNLKDILSSVWEWHRSHPEGYKA